MENKHRKEYRAAKVWFATFHAALGCFISSYNIGVFTSSQPCVAASLDWGDKKDTYIAIMSALLPLGALFGALGAGYFSKSLGRRTSLMIADLIIIVASCITILPITVAFGVGRFTSGIGLGCYSMLCPLYINEIAPVDITGKVGSMMMLFGSAGTLFAFGFALFLPTSNYKHDEMNNLWMAMFIFQGVVALIQLLLFMFVYRNETPHWLLNNNKDEEALLSLYTYYPKESAVRLVQEIQFKAANDSNNISKFDYSYREIFTCSPRTIKAMRLGLMLSIIQQFAGINAILSYATTLFGEFGSGVMIARVLTMISGGVQLVSSFGLLPLIDRFGRKITLVVGCFIMGFSLCSMGFFAIFKVYFVIPFLFIELYLAVFVNSIGPIVWIYSGEILPSRGMSICTAVNWFSAFLVVLFFPFLVQAIGLNYAFWCFAFINVAGGLYLWVDMVETKGMLKNDIRSILATMR